MPDDEDSKDLVDIFINESADDRGNAICAHAAFGEEFLFCRAYGWLQWTETHWQQEGAESALENALFALLKRRRKLAVEHEKEPVIKCTTQSTRRMRDCKAAFRSLVEVSVNEFDNQFDYLNVQNGIINLRTGDLLPHKPDHRFTYCLPVSYDPDAKSEEWLRFLAESVMGGSQVLHYLQQAVGYSFTGHTNEECFWYIHGPTRSGKGVFTETILALLPYPLGIQADFATFTSDRTGDTQNFDLAPLKPARFVVASESRRYESLNEAKIKAATGGDWIRCAFKYRDHFVYRPQFKIWLVSNHPVKADVDDDAIWYRLKVLQFPNGHAGAEDKTLKARLKRKETLQGVLTWIVKGAQMWYESKNGLDAPWAVEQSTQRQREDLDHVQQWINECLKPEDNNFLPNALLYHSYEQWCDDNGHGAYKARRFGQAMSGKGFERHMERVNGVVSRGFKGLIFKNEV